MTEQSKPTSDQPEDEVKRKYREALAHKQGHAGKPSTSAEGASKSGDPHGPAKAQRTFRRRSGSS